MLFENEPCWFAIHVKSGLELRIGSALKEKGYETFVPTYQLQEAGQGRTERPLFSGYVFCRFDPVVRALPRCAIRPTCRWFRQEGPAACFRCPQVVTDSRTASDLQREVAGDGSQLPENALYKPAGEAPS